MMHFHVGWRTIAYYAEMISVALDEVSIQNILLVGLYDAYSLLSKRVHKQVRLRSTRLRELCDVLSHLQNYILDCTCFKQVIKTGLFIGNESALAFLLDNKCLMTASPLMPQLSGVSRSITPETSVCRPK